MTGIAEVLSSGQPGTSGWLLLWLLKGSVLLALLFPVTRLLRRSSSSVRHLVWTAGLAIALLLPLLTASVLQWRVAVPSALWPQPAASGGSALPSSAAVPDAAGVLPAGGSAVPGSVTDATRDASAPPAESRTVAAGRARSSAAALPWLFVVWASGALLLLVRLLVSGLGVRRMVREGTPIDDPSWTTPLFEAADRLDLPDVPRLLLHGRAAMPLTCGIVRPAIVLPPEASGWAEERRRAVLCHELAHVRRRDVAVHLLGRVTCALYWFQPLAWSAARRLRAESERACDDLVLLLGTRPSAYADHLLQIATAARGAAAPLAALPLAQPREFEARLLSILAAGLRREPLPRRQSLALLALLAVLALPLVALTPAPPADADGAAAAAMVGVEPDAREPSDQTHRAAARRSPGETGGSAAAGREPGADDDVLVADAPQDDPRSREQPTGDSPRPAERGGAPDPPPAVFAPAAPPAAGAPPQTPGGDPRVIAGLIRALNDPAPRVRRSAAWALASHRDSAVADALARTLGSEAAAEVREMTAWALAQQGARVAGGAGVAALGAALGGDAVPAVRVTAAWALGSLGGVQGVQPLERAVRGDADGEVRATAAWALGNIASPTATATLGEAMRDTEPDVRERAAWALSRIGARPAPATLAAALRDPQPRVRLAAAWALGIIADADAADALQHALADADPEVGTTAAWALGRLPGGAGIDALTAALGAGNAAVRETAAATLGGRGSVARPWPWPWPWPRPMP